MFPEASTKTIKTSLFKMRKESCRNLYSMEWNNGNLKPEPKTQK
jgi:hypothetical protein